MSPRRPPPPHAQAHLPALNGNDALLIVNILERVTDAIWRAHGPAMHAALEESCCNGSTTVGASSKSHELNDTLAPDFDDWLGEPNDTLASDLDDWPF